MAATAVNAPMMPPAVLAELQPFVSLASGLGRTAVQLVGGDSGFTEVAITYNSPRGDDLDTRLLRAMVIKVGFQSQTKTDIISQQCDLFVVGLQDSHLLANFTVGGYGHQGGHSSAPILNGSLYFNSKWRAFYGHRVHSLRGMIIKVDTVSNLERNAESWTIEYCSELKKNWKIN